MEFAATLRTISFVTPSDVGLPLMLQICVRLAGICVLEDLC